MPWKKNLIIVTSGFLVGFLGFLVFLYFKPSQQSLQRDSRYVLDLSKQDREALLEIMKGNLEHLQKMYAYAANGDFKSLNTTALQMMDGNRISAHRGLIKALPREYKNLTLAMQKSLVDAAQSAKPEVPLKSQLQRLNAVMATCVNCHDQFRVR